MDSSGHCGVLLRALQDLGVWSHSCRQHCSLGAAQAWGLGPASIQGPLQSVQVQSSTQGSLALPLPVSYPPVPTGALRGYPNKNPQP